MQERIRGAGAVLVFLLSALALAGCATSPDALKAPKAEVVVKAAPPVSGPMPARDLARRLGLTYTDGSSHVLLENGPTRIRIWKNSDELSVGGQTVRLGDRTSRRGRNLIVPASMVSYLDRRVAEQRRAFAPRAPRPRPRRVTTAVRLPVLPEPKPVSSSAIDPDPVRAAPRVSPPDPSWEPRVTARPWKWIVLHHSDDRKGNFAKYDRIHRQSNGWDECGYHFVIGNGSLSRDGQVEIGTRWFKQKHGAHCKTEDNCFNDYGIGICLVGDFEDCGRPSCAQMQSLVSLCRWLMARFDIPAQNVLGHSDCKATACPGRCFPWGELRSCLGCVRP
jgi:hypothetical protein